MKNFNEKETEMKCLTTKEIEMVSGGYCDTRSWCDSSYKEPKKRSGDGLGLPEFKI